MNDLSRSEAGPTMEPAQRIHRRFAYSLCGKHPIRVLGAKGCRVQCVGGLALLTAFNDLKDFELYPGQSMVVANDGLLLIEGIDEPTELIFDFPRTFGISLLGAVGMENFMHAGIRSMARIGATRIALPAGRVGSLRVGSPRPPSRKRAA